MQIFDPKFKENKKQYIFQALIVVIIVFILLLSADSISEMTIIASLGASTYTAFSFPNKRSTLPRNMIGGYAIGIIVGIAFHYVNTYLDTTFLSFFGKPSYMLTCALAVGIVMFIMNVTNCEHPPAAGIAMSLIVDENKWMTSLIAFISIIIISTAKTIMKKWLKDLL